MRCLNPLRSRPLKSNILFDYQQISSAKAFVYLQVFVSLHTESLQIFMIKTTNNTPSLFSNLSDMLNQLHPLYKLANKIDWTKFEKSFTPLYCSGNGRPGKPIRMMCGLLILKHLRNLSDESVVEQWSENAYYQYFCGMQEFTPSAPCASSELVHFRNRIGEKGIELIFQESIRMNNEGDGKHHHDTAFIDSTVQEISILLSPPMRSCIKRS